MKKFSVLTTIVILMVVGISCEKESSNDLLGPDENNLVVEKNDIISANMKTYFDNGHYPGIDGRDFGCMSPASNCYVGKNINVTYTDTPTPFFTVDENHPIIKLINNQNLNLPYQIKKENDQHIFAYHQSYMNTVFGSYIVGRVIDGTLTLKIRGENHQIQKCDNNYFIFSHIFSTPTSDPTYRVTPINTYIGFIID